MQSKMRLGRAGQGVARLGTARPGRAWPGEARQGILVYTPETMGYNMYSRLGAPSDIYLAVAYNSCQRDLTPSAVGNSRGVSLSPIRGGGELLRGDMEDNLNSRGYVPLPRYAYKLKFFEWALYAQLYYLASYKPRRDPKTGIELDAGQCISTRSGLAARLGVSIRVIRRLLNRLKRSGLIDTTTLHRRGILVTVKGYDDNGCRSEKQGGHSTVLKRSSNGPLTVPINNGEQNTYPESGPLMVLKRSSNGPLTVPRTNKKEEKRNKKKEKDSMSESPIPTFPVSELVKLWNEICPPHALPSVTRISEKRRTAAKARLKELPDLEKWRQVFEWIVESPFHLGENARGWRANFDYIIRPDKALRILEEIEAGEAEYYWEGK